LKPPRSPIDRPRSYQKSGIHTLKKAVVTLGSRALPPKSTALGRALHDWRDSLIADLGGVDTISTQQAALVDLAVRTKLLVDSVDAYVLAMPSPVNRQRRCLHPVVRERQALVGQLQSILRDLGLERRAKDAGDLAAQLAALHAARPANGGEAAMRAATAVQHAPKDTVRTDTAIGGEDDEVG
jgi:hypothetical protein